MSDRRGLESQRGPHQLLLPLFTFLDYSLFHSSPFIHSFICSIICIEWLPCARHCQVLGVHRVEQDRDISMQTFQKKSNITMYKATKLANDRYH